jgi:hypothetical protein
MCDEERPEVCHYCNEFLCAPRGRTKALQHVAYLAHLISGNATMRTVDGGGFWTVTQSSMSSLRAGLACLDRHMNHDVR